MKELEFYIAAAAVCFLLLAGELWYDSSNPHVCVDESKVADIVSLHYRSATIKLEDGRLVTVHQATLKKGDEYCVKYK